jgi:cell division protein FtsB
MSPYLGESRNNRPVISQEESSLKTENGYLKVALGLVFALTTFFAVKWYEKIDVTMTNVSLLQQKVDSLTKNVETLTISSNKKSDEIAKLQKTIDLIPYKYVHKE